VLRWKETNDVVHRAWTNAAPLNTNLLRFSKLRRDEIKALPKKEITR
jgi:hypothetical protein